MLSKDNWILRFPKHLEHYLAQNEEYCVIENRRTGKAFEVRLHEYGKIYNIPGLYEYLFCNQLKYCSPEKVCGFLKDEISKELLNPEDLCVLDLGAGNGIAGEALKKIGVKTIYGIDIEKEAEKAVKRDRPDVYERYYTANLLKMPYWLKNELMEKSFNCLVSVGSLGFDDIPPKVFGIGFNLLSVSGWVAFNINEDFLSDNDHTGFSSMIHRMQDAGILTTYTTQRYQHRLSIHDKPLYYVAIVGKKNSQIPLDWL